MPPKYIDNILKRQKEYFGPNSELYDQFLVLAPDQWESYIPLSEGLLLYRLGERLGTKKASRIRTVWQSFKSMLMKHQLFCGSRDELHKSPESFWSAVLNDETIEVPECIRDLIRTVLILPTG